MIEYFVPTSILRRWNPLICSVYFIFVNTIRVTGKMHWIECRLFSSHIVCIELQKPISIIRRDCLPFCLYSMSSHVSFFHTKVNHFRCSRFVCITHKNSYFIDSVTERPTNQTKIQSACIYIWNCNFMKAVNLKRDLYFLFSACELKQEEKNASASV